MRHFLVTFHRPGKVLKNLFGEGISGSASRIASRRPDQKHQRRAHRRLEHGFLELLKTDIVDELAESLLLCVRFVIFDHFIDDI
jgi:hypothetical protein